MSQYECGLAPGEGWTFALQEQVDEIAEKYRDALWRGETPSREAIVASWEEHAQILDERLVLVSILFKVGQTSRPARLGDGLIGGGG